jgi:hypothetical protein
MPPERPTTCTGCPNPITASEVPVLAGPPNLRASALGDVVARYDTREPSPYHDDHVPRGYAITRRWNDDRQLWDVLPGHLAE